MIWFFMCSLAVACVKEQRVDVSELRGAVLSQALPKPRFTFTATDGQPFDFRRETDGYVTLLFFGYTHCPDVCPLHMANIAAVLRKLPPRVSDRVKVVFVSVDPERDSAAAIRAWLDNFDTSFIGLTGPADSIASVLMALRLAPAFVPPGASADSAYLVGHAAAVVAFTTDDSARVVYPFGIRQNDWAHDLPRLVGSP